MSDETKKKRGFAAMHPDKQREIASRGGKAAQANGNCHTFTREEASAAGKIGSARNRGNTARMQELGRLGGRANAARARAARITVDGKPLSEVVAITMARPGVGSVVSEEEKS